MIGMLNNGPDDGPAEFYSSPQRSSLYRHKLLEDKEKPVKKAPTESPEKLWEELILRAFCYMSYRGHIFNKGRLLQ